MAGVLPVINAAFTSIGTYLGVIAPVVAPVVVETGVAVTVLPYLPMILSGAGVLAGLSYLKSRVNSFMKDEHKQEDEVRDRVKNLEKTNEEMRKTLEDTLKLTQQLLQKLLRKEKNIDQSEYQDSEVPGGSAVTSQERPTPQERVTTQKRPIAQERSTTQERITTQEHSVTQRRSTVAAEERPAVTVQERSAEAVLEQAAVNGQIRELRVLIHLYEDYIARYANQPSRLLEETQNFQRNLCAQLKRVSSAMLDGFMSADALNIWVNGAAFHIQMLSLMAGAGDESLESLLVAVRIHRDTTRILCSEYITSNQLTSNEKAQIHDLEIFFDDAYTRVKLNTQNLKVTSQAAIESVEEKN